VYLLRLLLIRGLSGELYLIAALVGLSTASVRFLPVAAWGCLAFCLLRFVRRRLFHQSARHSPWLTADPFVTLLILTLGLSVLITAFPDNTVPQVLRTFTGIALFYAIVNWANERNRIARLRLITIALCGGLSVMALAGPFIVDWQEGKFLIIPGTVYANFRLLVSDSVNPNVLAGALIIFMPLPLANLSFLVKDCPALDLVTSVVSLILSIIMLVLAQSRGALVAFAIATTALLVLRRWKIVIVLAILAILIAVYFLLDTAALIATAESLSVTNALNGLDNRIEIWSRAWYMVQDFAFTGIGMGSFEQVTEMLYPLIITPPGVPHAHNLFLQIAVDLGVPGLIAWLGILITVIVSSWRAYRSADSTLRALGAGLLASQVALCVHGLTDAVTWGMVRSAPLVWALWGAAVAAGLAARGSGVDQPPALTGPSRSVESRDGDQREHGQHHHAPNPPIPDHTGHAPMSVHLADQRRPAVCQSQQAGDDGRIRVARAGQP
jgi:putative inorganic carbon (HCO3(-)) transporter